MSMPRFHVYSVIEGKKPYWRMAFASISRLPFTGNLMQMPPREAETTIA